LTSFEILHAPKFGRAPGEQAKIEVAVVGLRQERRNGRAEEHQRDPGIEGQQDHGKRAERQKALRHDQHVGDHAHGAEVGFAAGVLQLIIELGILKIVQVERLRLAHDRHVDRMRETRVEDMVKQGAALAQHSAQRDQAKFKQQIGQRGT
jgi:hypothetical protein